MKYTILTFILVFFSFSFCYSQQFNFTNYNIEQGLAQSQVFAMCEDSRGNIWIGTDGGGISIFDGLNFKYITKDDGLPSPQIRSIYEDSNGTIWVGTKDNYLCSYNGVKITYYNKDQGLTNASIQAIIEDKIGNLWIGTAGGLFVKRNNKFQKINLKRDSSNVVIQTFLVDKIGKLWVGTLFDGVFINDNLKIKHITTRNGLCNDAINSMTEDIHGNIWIATKYGVDKYDGYRFYNWNTNNGLLNNNVNTVLSDKSGNIWFGYSGSGVSRYNGTEFFTFNEKNGLCYNYIKGMIQDRSGNMWFSTDGAGICKFEGERFVHITEKDGLPTSVIMSIYQDKDANYWFGTYGAGVCKYDESGFTTFTVEKNDLCSDLIYSIHQDSKGNMWFGSKGGGLSIYNGKTFKTYNSKNGLSHDYIYSITEDKFGNIIIGANGGGLMIYDGSTFTKIGKNEGLASDLVYTVFIDNKDNIWLGTEDSGADMIFADFGVKGLIENKKIDETEHLIISRKFGMSYDQVFSITQDLNGNMWFGTFSGGLYRFDGKRITNFTTKDGLNSNNIYFVYVDSQGFIWAGTEKGLNRITFIDNIEKPVIKCYSKSEGFKGIETNLNSVFEDKNGFLWFGTIKGVTVHHPNSDKPNLEEPLIRISNMKLSFDETDWSEYTDSLTKWGNIPIELTLPYNKNHLTFSFSGVDQTCPEKVRYQWMLEGFDKKWAPSSSSNEVIYSYIPPGNYTFKVKSCNNDGVCNKEPATVHFIITPPFWSTWWFYLISIILGASLIALIIISRTKKLKKDKKILEQKVLERTAEIVEKNEELNQQKEELHTQKEHLELINIEINNKNEEINAQKEELENSLKTINLLTSVGQIIISDLNLSTIIDTFYENLNSLIDATTFALFRFNEKNNTLDVIGGKEKGVSFPFFFYNLETEDTLAVYCFKKQEVIIINDFMQEYNKYISKISPPKAGENPDSIIYVPINSKNKKIGVITIQSFSINAYNEYHVNIVQNLANYIAIAIDNSNAYSILEEQKVQIEKALIRLKQTQTQLVEAEKMAALGGLVAGVAHEINTPVGIGITASSTLNEKTKLISEAYFSGKMRKSDLDSFFNEAGSISELILDNLQRTGELIQSFKQVSVDQVTEQQREFNFRTYLADVVRSVLPRIKHTKIELEYICNEDIQMNSFPGPFAQIITNFVVNSAVHAFADETVSSSLGKDSQVKTPDRGRDFQNFKNLKNLEELTPDKDSGSLSDEPEVCDTVKEEIKIEASLKNKKLLLIYSDNGKGMSAEVLKHIYDPFYTTNKQKGTGLGMHIIYNLVTQKLQGSINAESEIGKGVRFTIECPVEVKDIEKMPEA